jgi:hypothetical protein
METPLPHPRRRNGRAWIWPLLACFLLLALFGAHRLNDSDMGFHLKAGRWILENHRFPERNTFTYTVPDRPYLDMEGLYQAGVYLLYRMGGYPLLSLFHILLALLSFLAVWFRIRSAGVPGWMGLAFFIPAVLASESRVRDRPEVLSWLLLALMLWALESRTRAGKDRLFLLPLLQWVWVNTEGLFFIGWFVMAAYCLPGLLRKSHRDRKLLRYTGWSMVLCLANPHFLRGIWFPFSFLDRLGSSKVFQSAAQEFQPPWSLSDPNHPFPPSYLLAYKAFSLVLLFLLAARFRRLKIREVLPAIFFFGLSAIAARNIPLFLIACAPLAASLWKDLPWEGLRKFQERFLAGPAFAAAATIFLLGFSLRVVTNAHYVSRGLSDRFGLGLDREALPEGGCEFLRDRGLDGKILNTLDAGDWLDWCAPQKPFIDGRLDVMGTNLMAEYTRSLAPGGLEPLLAQYGPDILFFNPLYATQWTAWLAGQPGWRPVYLDAGTAIYLRRGYRDDVPALEDRSILQEAGVSPSVFQDAPALLDMPPSSDWKLFWRGFLEPSRYPDALLNEGVWASYAGRSRTAEALYLEAIRRSRGRYWEFYFNLGVLYAYDRQPLPARACLSRVLEERPHNAVAREILSGLSGA